MVTEPDENLIRRRARDLLKRGISKEEAYDELIDEFGNRSVTAKVLKRLPSAKAWKKYGIWNHVLAAIMIVLATMSIGDGSTGAVLWYGLLIIVIMRCQTRFYYWVAVMATMGVIVVMGSMFIGTIKAGSMEILMETWPAITGYFVLLLTSFYLAYWLPQKLTPEPMETREYYENDPGKPRSRVIYHFRED